DAQWLKIKPEGLHNAKILQGKPLSYNNLLDIDASVAIANMFGESVCVAVKHNNPCGVSLGKDSLDAVQKCLKADPISVFGGILAMNKPVDAQVAKELGAIFLECVIAPKYDSEALEL